MTDDWTYDTWVGFPQGFTVRDLGTLYDVLGKALGDLDPEMYPWEADGMDLPDVTLGEIRAMVAAVETAEWDVEPDVTALREILEAEE